MKYYKLNNGVLMPAFGLGTFRMEKGESTYDTVLSALKLGYRHIDTAMYYFNEEDVGRAVRDSNLKREDVFITTKIMKQHEGDASLIRKDIEGSLERLNLDYIDLLLIHWPNHDYKINEIVWKVFEEFYDAKKVRAIGVSNFNIHHLDALLKTAKIKPVVNQVECHPLLSQVPLHNYLKKHDIYLGSYGPFAKGEIFKGTVFELLKEIGNKYEATPAEVVIAWGIKRNIIMIPKTVHEDRLKTNFRGSQIELSDEDFNKINSLNIAKRLYTDPENGYLFK